MIITTIKELEELQLEDYSKVTKVILFNKGFISIPDKVFLLTNLEKLNVNNKLNTIPKIIGNLTKLKQLSICNNKLIDITNSIGQLNKLVELYINNELVDITNSIGNLDKLEVLYVNNNKLKTLLDSIGNLDRLI